VKHKLQNLPRGGPASTHINFIPQSLQKLQLVVTKYNQGKTKENYEM
jgi:hypothetical protein